MKKKIMQLKIEAEKLENLKSARAGHVFCCHATGTGCDCTNNPNLFEVKFNIWVDLMDIMDTA
jgi:hypothetical protein